MYGKSSGPGPYPNTKVKYTFNSLQNMWTFMKAHKNENCDSKPLANTHYVCYIVIFSIFASDGTQS